MHPPVLLINYAIGGASGWKINLERYNNTSEMFVDYLRVFKRIKEPSLDIYPICPLYWLFRAGYDVGEGHADSYFLYQKP